ncbi:hypothetical protein BDZ89DRAFT_1147073 [Hymenopellis radicata]|nr:hypothetical protein BDZ89DRAFT_1147073 [Hymenopellis radicata]
MPLVLSPESTCDICSSHYADDIVVPHVVSCGHVFCKTCLTTHFFKDNAANPQCPYCRKHFSIPDTNLPYDKRFGKVVKRLFVHYESADSEQTLLAELALSLRPSSPDDSSLAQLDEKITHWLEDHEDHVALKETHAVVIKHRAIERQWEQMTVVVGKMHDKLNEIESTRIIIARYLLRTSPSLFSLRPSILRLCFRHNVSTLIQSDVSGAYLDSNRKGLSKCLEMDIPLVNIPMTPARHDVLELTENPHRNTDNEMEETTSSLQVQHGIMFQVVPPTTPPAHASPATNFVRNAMRDYPVEASSATERHRRGPSLSALQFSGVTILGSESSTPSSSPRSAQSGIRLDHSRYNSPEPHSPLSPGHNFLSAAASLRRRQSSSSIFSNASWNSRSSDASFFATFPQSFQDANTAFWETPGFVPGDVEEARDEFFAATSPSHSQSASDDPFFGSGSTTSI